MNEELLKDLIEKLNSINSCEQFGIVTIFTKDLVEYIATSALTGKGVAFLQTTYTDAIAPDRYYWECRGGELFQSIRTEDYETNFAHTPTLVCRDDFFETGDEVLDQEWLRYPGWSIARTLKESIQRLDQEPPILVEEYFGDELTREEEACNLAKVILETHFTAETHWYPFVALISLVLLKACEP